MSEIVQIAGDAPPPRSPDPEDVRRGKDGWLFLVGGSNRVLDFFTLPEAFPDSMVQAWVALLRRRRDRCAAKGMQYLHMFAPEKLSVYFDKFDGDLPYRERTPIVSVAKAARAAGVGDAIVDVLPFMLQQKADNKLFFQTDTHWTFEGCLCALQVLCAQLGVTISPTIIQGKRLRGQLALDLGAKLSPPIKEEFVLVSFLTSARRVAVNSMVAFKELTKRENDGGLHVGSNVVYCNHRPGVVDKTVVLFGDSFAEYRSHLLTGMLAETFREVHFVWSTNIDWNYVDRVKPDILLTEASERFALQVPNDEFDLDKFVVRRLAPMMLDTPA
jgi:alginate O-acetyltransferase complex protein AlgJ